MSGRKAKQHRRDTVLKRLQLVTRLTEYWFYRLHTGLSEDEAVSQMTELYLKIDALSGQEIEQLRLATAHDIHQVTP